MRIHSESFGHGEPIPPAFALGAPDGFGGNRNPHLAWDDVPEGTRSFDGKLKAFKHGAFTLAQRVRVPLLPIVIQGTSEALPKRGFVLRGRHAIHVRILDEIAYETFADVPVDTVIARVRGIIATELGQVAGG